MRLETWQSRYERIKDLTFRIRKHLAETTVKILGSTQWWTPFGQDPANIDYNSLSARTIVELAIVIANDPTEGPLVSNLFLNRLRDAIELRKYQSDQYTTRSTDEIWYKQEYLSHLNFVEELQRAKWTLLAGIRVHYLPIYVTDSNLQWIATNAYDCLSAGSVDLDIDLDQIPPSPRSVSNSGSKSSMAPA
jgi:hypothetical protein